MAWICVLSFVFAHLFDSLRLCIDSFACSQSKRAPRARIANVSGFLAVVCSARNPVVPVVLWQRRPAARAPTKWGVRLSPALRPHLQRRQPRWWHGRQRFSPPLPHPPSCPSTCCPPTRHSTPPSTIGALSVRRWQRRLCQPSRRRRRTRDDGRHFRANTVSRPSRRQRPRPDASGRRPGAALREFCARVTGAGVGTSAQRPIPWPQRRWRLPQRRRRRGQHWRRHPSGAPVPCREATRRRCGR